MHVAVAMNLCGDVVIQIVFGSFGKINHQKAPKLVPVRNLKLPRVVFNVLSLRLSLKKTPASLSQKKGQKYKFAPATN